MRDIDTTVTMTARQYVGDEPLLVLAASGEILQHRPVKADKKARTVCPASARIIVGTEAEIAAEHGKAKPASDAIKAQREAAREAARAS